MISLTTGTEMPFRGTVANCSDPGPQSVAPPSQASPHCNHAKHFFNALQLPSQFARQQHQERNGQRPPQGPVLSDTICQQMQMMSEALLFEVFADANLTAIRNRRLTVTPKDMRASATDEGYHLINLNIEKMREEEERSHEDDEMTDKEDASDPEKEQ
ncbi:hypothetical protein D6C84_02953 [Aureobasidium pullulans]|uniref:Core Histone H2A/H2B/H3 domain-containing protein n=1 Tax=Aureobasidium pullulans TaxID=5580 RepID=A0A4S9Y012_AURPU|nr:hypothetical protein D6C84_02953 [Aureobasidium pullulans]